MADNDVLKDAFRQFRIEYDARLAETYLTKSAATQMKTEYNTQVAATYLTKAEASQFVNKRTPTLSLGTWSVSGTTYSTTISYNGDGALSSSIGTISGNTLSVTSANGVFSGTITATAGNSYQSTTLNFNYSTSGDSPKTAPTLEIEPFGEGDNVTVITYNGDGVLYCNTDTPFFGAMIEDTSSSEYNLYVYRSENAETTETSCTVTVYATEGTNYAAKTATVEYTFEEG